MKKITICILMLIPFIGYSQKKANGTIYIEHPAINVVDAFTKAWVAGDTTAMAKMMSSDFKAFNAVTSQVWDNGTKQAPFLRNARFWHDQLDYFSVKTMPGSYPDAFEYTKNPTDKNAVTVTAWDVVNGMHKTTGVRTNMILHRSYTFTKDNKISMLVSYVNPEVGNNIGMAMSERKNGTIYNEHANINMLRRMMGAAENGDWDKFYSGFDPKATFYYSNDPDMKAATLSESKASDKAILEKFDLKGIEQVGYPDFLQYEMGNAGGNSGVLYSWWNFHFVRKSDKKDIKLRVHYAQDVNAEGKIVNEIAYFNGDLLK